MSKSVCIDCQNGHHSVTALAACDCACHPNKVDSRRPFPTAFVVKWTATAATVGAVLWFGAFLYEFFTLRVAVLMAGSILAFPAALALRWWARMGTRLLVRAAHLKVEQYFTARDTEREQFSAAIEQGFELLRVTR